MYNSSGAFVPPRESHRGRESEPHSRHGDIPSQRNFPNQGTNPRREPYVNDWNRREGSSRRRNDADQQRPPDISEGTVQRHPLYVRMVKVAENQSLRIRQLEDELAFVKAALQHEESAHRSTQKLLEEKNAELQGANEFLTQTDQLSCADVVGMVETLNFDIQQVAAQIASSYGSYDVEGVGSSQDAHRAQNSVTNKIGLDLSKLTDNPTLKDDQGLRGAFVEFMIQGFMVYDICRDVLENQWSSNPDLDKTLSIVYERIAAEGSTATRPIAGKWRTLTHTASHSPFAADSLVNVALYYTRLILIAFGATDVPPHEEFRAAFHGEVEPIINNLLKLDLAIKEKISSCIIHPWIPESGSPAFWDTMTDANSPESQVQEEPGPRILTTVALGLYKTDNACENPTLMLKAQVVLERLVHGLDMGEEVDEIEDREVEEIMMPPKDGH